MRRFTAAAVAGVCVLAAACGGNNSSAPAASSAKAGAGGSTTSTPPPPVAVSALDGLLLSPDQINTAMGATAMTVGQTYTRMADAGPNVADVNCRSVHNSAESSAFADSGWTALRGQQMQEPGDNFTHFVKQNVVSFPSATAAAAFFDASTHRWPACSNRQYTFTQSGQPNSVWTAGPISTTAGTLSTTTTEEGGNGWACQRALTVRNNVAVDIGACSYSPANSAVNIAHQIAAKIPTQ
jgi:serine/threonine kinase PknH